MKYKTFEFVIPLELHETLKKTAKGQDMPLSQLVRRILREWVEKNVQEKKDV